MLNVRQNEIVVGSLLGDGTIWNDFIDGHSLKLEVTQSKLDNIGADKKTYIIWFMKEFMNLGCSIKPRKYTTKKIAYNKEYDIKKTFLAYVFTTRCNKFWNELEKKWYVPIEHPYYRRRKIVPLDIKLTPLTLCVWHMDDGSNYAKDANITLETEGFTEDEVLFLIERLKIDLNIKSNIKWTRRKTSGVLKRQPRIYIPRESYFDFIDIIKPHVEWDCFQYKLDTTTYNKETQIGEHHSRAKLTNEVVRKIIQLREQGKQQDEIAKIAGVTDSAINMIITGKRWSHLTGIKYKKKLKRVDRNKVFELAKNNLLTQKEIAIELNANPSTISRILRK